MPGNGNGAQTPRAGAQTPRERGAQTPRAGTTGLSGFAAQASEAFEAAFTGFPGGGGWGRRYEVDEDLSSEVLRFLETSEEEQDLDERGGIGVNGELYHSAMAASFAEAQRVLAQSHESALGLIAKCLTDAHQKEMANNRLRTQVARLSANVQESAASAAPEHEHSASNVRGSMSLRRQPSSKSLRLPGLSRAATTCFDGGERWAAGSQDMVSRRAPSPRAPSPRAPSPCAPVCLPAESSAKEPPNVALLPGLPGVAVSPRDAIGVPTITSFATAVGKDDDKSRAPSPHYSERSNGSGDKQPVEPVKLPRMRRPSIASYMSCQSQASMQSCSPHYELLAVWNQKPLKKSKRGRSHNMRKLSRSCSTESLGSVESLDIGYDANPWHIYGFPVLDPNSRWRILWDIFGILLVMYDTVVIPLQVFEDLPQGWFLESMQWVTRVFWTLDIILCLLTGILKPDGSIEMNPAKIARTYVWTWFGPDVLIVGCDWCEIFFPLLSFVGFARVGKVTRTFRILRMMRLMRMERVRHTHAVMLTNPIAGQKSEQLIIIAGILNNLIFIIGLGHVIACLWYEIADERRQTRTDTWLDAHGFADESLALKYTTALHWSLLQFAGGTDEIVPHNTAERVFAIGAFILSFVMATVFVGRLTSSMTQLHMLSRKDLEKFQTLKQYLMKNAISTTLTMRIMHNAQHALSEKQRFMEESRVELLHIISEPLRVEVHFELYAPVLQVHPFFRCFIEACPQVMKKVCHKAMSLLAVSNGDVIFMLGEVPTPPRMFIICSGELSYHSLSGAVAYVESGQWISEATLWVNAWTHQGMLKAVSDCRLCVLDAQKFVELTEAFDFDFDVRSYARTFVKCMNSGAIDSTDLPYWEDAEEIMEAIASLTPQRDGERGKQEGGSFNWGRQSTSNSICSSATSGSDQDPASPKTSVLMVNPGGSSDESQKKAWW